MRASTRWRRAVRARLAEMERLRPGRGGVGPEYWNSAARARRYHSVVAGSAEGDPLLDRLRGATTADSTVLDVGAGTGRFSLALAPAVREVVAVDSSRAMLAVLRREARRQGLPNVRCLEGRWPDVALDRAGGEAWEPADVVVCSFVLPLVEDAAGFVAGLHAACRGRAFLYMNAASADAFVDPFWRHFHGRPRRPGPTWLDLVAVVRELGIRPDAEVVEARTLSRFKTLAAAVKSYHDTLLLPDTPEARSELRTLLGYWLVRDGSALRPPVPTVPAAIVSWAGGAA